MRRKSNQSPQPNGADTGETRMNRDAAEIPAQLNELLERGEISPEAFAEYAATADAALSLRQHRPKKTPA